MGIVTLVPLYRWLIHKDITWLTWGPTVSGRPQIWTQEVCVQYALIPKFGLTTMCYDVVVVKP